MLLIVSCVLIILVTISQDFTRTKILWSHICEKYNLIIMYIRTIKCNVFECEIFM